MIKKLSYRYVGTNGILDSSIQLPGVPCVTRYILIADEGKKLTKDGVHFLSTVILTEEAEIAEWHEEEGQNELV